MQDNRLRSVDLMKGIAIFMVIFIHASDGALKAARAFDLEWISVVTINACSRVCVPWFVILSGFLLLDPKKTNCFLQFYRRRLTRLLLPFVFWIVVYSLWRHFHQGQKLTGIQWITEAVNGRVYYHLWFLYMILGLYVSAPFLSRMLQRLNNAERAMFMSLWFCLASVLPWVEWFGKVKFPMPLGYFSSYFGYFLFGGWAREWEPTLRSRRLLGAAALILVASTSLGTYLISARDNDFNQVFMAYLAPNIVVMSLASWIYFMMGNVSGIEQQSSVSRLLTFAGSRSLFVYGIHILVLEIINGNEAFNHAGMLMKVVVMTIVTFLVSVGIARLLRRIPLAARLTG